MSSDGKELEPFVAFAESLLVPQGLQLRVTRSEWKEAPERTAEIDIAVTGQLATLPISWQVTLELAGAVESGLELKGVRALEPARLGEGPLVQYFTKIEEVASLRKFIVRLGPEIPRNARRRVAALLEKVGGRVGAPFITVRRSKQLISAWHVFASYARERRLYGSLTPNAPAQDVALTIRITDHLGIETPLGVAGITEIYCEGSLQIARVQVPLLNVFAFDHGTGPQLPDTLKYPSININEKLLSLELQRLAGTNQGRIVGKGLDDSG
jgi:hypothetical protein